MRDYYKYLTSLSKNSYSFDSGKEYIKCTNKQNYKGKLCKQNFLNTANNSKQSIVYLGEELHLIEKHSDYYARFLYKTLLDFIGIKIDADSEILVVGMGNQFMTADSLGIQIAKELIPTRHIKKDGDLHVPSLSVFIPNVLGVTGIETAHSVNAICNIIKPDLVIALDSLCAHSLSRFVKTVQFSNNGITPGAGVANARKKLDKDSLGCEVVAIGVPLLIKNLQEMTTCTGRPNYFEKTETEDKANAKINSSRKNILSESETKQSNTNNKKDCNCCNSSSHDMYFTVADIDEKLRVFSKIIAGAINLLVTE